MTTHHRSPRGPTNSWTRIARTTHLAALLGAVLTSPTALAAEPALRAPAVERALGVLRTSSPSLRVTWKASRRTPATLTLLAEPVTGATNEARAADFLRRHAAIFDLPEGALAVRAESTSAGRTHVTLEQRFEGLTVEGRGATITLARDRVLSVVNDTEPLAGVDRATIDADRARALALEAVFGAPSRPSLEGAEVIRHAIAVSGGRGVEVYRVGVLRRPLVEQLEVLVDAHAGRVIGLVDRTANTAPAGLGR